MPWWSLTWSIWMLKLPLMNTGKLRMARHSSKSASSRSWGWLPGGQNGRQLQWQPGNGGRLQSMKQSQMWSVMAQLTDAIKSSQVQQGWQRWCGSTNKSSCIWWCSNQVTIAAAAVYNDTVSIRPGCSQKQYCKIIRNNQIDGIIKCIVPRLNSDASRVNRPFIAGNHGEHLDVMEVKLEVTYMHMPHMGPSSLPQCCRYRKLLRW